tara:strand:+ start:282 stop:455 length:174 start_codon:yes stop_codon:yes gene_type:complete
MHGRIRAFSATFGIVVDAFDMLSDPRFAASPRLATCFGFRRSSKLHLQTAEGASPSM